MKKILKRLIASICALSLIISMITVVQASGGVSVVVGSAKLTQASGEESVEVPIDLSNNTGIATMTLKITYTEGLTLTGITKGSGLETLTMTKPGNFAANPFNLVWDGESADTSNGTVATLTFTVPKDTVKDYEINVETDGVFDNDLNEVEIGITNGKIFIEEKPKENFTGLSIADATYTYDGTEKALAVSGVPSGATVTYTSADFDTDGRAIDAGTYNIRATVKKDGYNDWSDEATLTINPKTVSVTGLIAANKVYDGTNEATLSGGTISGLVARDAADQYCDEHQGYRIKYYIPEIGIFSDANVGTNKAVEIAEIELTGCSADNYVLTQPTGLKANITKAPITIKAKDVTIKTDAAIPVFDDNSYDITSGKLFGEDKITGKLATNCTSTSVAKDFNITQGTLTAGNNYDLTFVAGKLSVVDKTPQAITVDGVVENKTYGDEGFKITVTPDAISKLDNFTMASSNANVATVEESGNVTIKGAGVTTLSVKEAGNEEYAAFEKTWKLTVDKAKVTIIADNITKKIGQNDPELTYVVTGSLYGDDKVSGELTRASGELVGKYDILIGTLVITDNYEINFNKGVFEIVEKTPQFITVADINGKTYGDEPFKLEVTPDATSKLDTFTYASSNTDVADVAADGTVTIKSAGEATITVSQNGNEEYALAEKTVKLVVNPITVTVTAIDMDNKTATIEGVLEEDRTGVELDFDSIKTTVISSEKSTVEETTTITSTLKVTNFAFKGEKAKNYVADKAASLTTTVSSTTVSEKLTEDENVTIEAAPVDEKTIIVTDVAVAPESEVKKVTIDVTAIADTKVNTVALPKTTVDAIIGIDSEVALEITLKDGSDENKESKITLNSQALSAIQTAGSAATTLSVSVDKTEKEELATEQAARFDEVSTKTPVVYSLSIVDEAGNSVASSFGDAGKATVTLPYMKPAGNGNVIVKYLDDLGNLTNILNPKYDANSKTVTVELGHFSEYLIYTEPVVSYGGGGGSVSSYIIRFETNGGSKVEQVRVRPNATLTEPTTPVKEGYIFAGWYTDKELKNAYDFSKKVSRGFTLYAGWNETEKSQIILTIGEKDAIVFGETKTNDVAPIIKNDRTMLPIRFIAEALGAAVEWNEADRTVGITAQGIEIKITIDSDKAVVNQSTVDLDSVAFIANDRTYLPLRFVAENLGAKVEWDEKTQKITITK